MPTYVYKCQSRECSVYDLEFEAIVNIDERDLQYCARCGGHFKRLVAFNGLTWAPTAGGMR